MHRLLRRVAPVLLGTVVLAGCSDGDGSSPTTLELDRTPTASSEAATPSATPSPSAGGGPIPEEPEDETLTRGLSAAKGEKAKAAEEVWFQYWEELLRMYRTQEIDRDRVYELADGPAAEGPLDYAQSIIDDGNDQVGGMILSAISVEVEGDRAVIEGCVRNTTQDVDARTREPVEALRPFFVVRDVLRREGPTWRVVEEVPRSVPGCAYR